MYECKSVSKIKIVKRDECKRDDARSVKGDAMREISYVTFHSAFYSEMLTKRSVCRINTK